jgi:hypothetical protein
VPGKIAGREREMKNEKQIRDEVRAVRQRVAEFSGYWVGEAAASIYALEWVLEKRVAHPSSDLGLSGGEHEKIAAGLLKIAETKKPTAAKIQPAARQKTADDSKKKKLRI